MSELQFLKINERAYKYIRQFTIKTVEDGLVELITNSIDAYKKGQIEKKKVSIIFIEPNIIQVIDNALGLTSLEMKECFLQVGNYTNVPGSRGFFSRGAKDVSALGNITFHSIKDEKYSECYLDFNAYGSITVSDVTVTDEQRSLYKIPSNGLAVSIELLSNKLNFTDYSLCRNLSTICSLRRIMEDPNNEITYSHGNFIKRLEYQYPKGETLLELKYQVPNYTNYLATLEVYRTSEQLPQPSTDAYMQFGILIEDSTTVYEVSCLDNQFRWNPYINYIYGSLRCNGISELLQEYEVNGPSEKNPTPIVDPSRLTGLDKSHPFVLSLVSVAKTRLDQILRAVSYSSSKQSLDIKDIDDLLDELSNYGLNMMGDENIKIKYVSDYDSKLATAISDDRVNYVVKEKSYYQSLDNQEDNIIKSKIVELSKTNPNVIESNFIVSQDNELKKVDLNSKVEFTNSRPYIYQVTQSGDLVKLFLFEKGRVENINNVEEKYVLEKKRNFNIVFFSDPKIKTRYIVEYQNGITVKINASDPSIRKNLGENLDFSSTHKVIYLKEMFTQIFADIILESQNEKHRSITTQRNNLISKIQSPVETLFEKYLNNTNISST